MKCLYKVHMKCANSVTECCIEPTDIRCEDSRSESGSQTKEKKKQRIENYNLLKVLGKGTFGKVMLAERKDTHELFAIKAIKKSSTARDCIMTEKSVLKLGAQHPFITTLYSCFQTSDRFFFVMEYESGGSLWFHFKNRSIGKQRTSFYAAEISLALEFLHRRSIIYRDLKLENVLLDQEGHVKLVDFGLSKVNTYARDTIQFLLQIHIHLLSAFIGRFIR